MRFIQCVEAENGCFAFTYFLSYIYAPLRLFLPPFVCPPFLVFFFFWTILMAFYSNMGWLEIMGRVW